MKLNAPNIFSFKDKAYKITHHQAAVSHLFSLQSQTKLFRHYYWVKWHSCFIAVWGEGTLKYDFFTDPNSKTYNDKIPSKWLYSNAHAYTDIHKKQKILLFRKSNVCGYIYNNI